MKKLLSLTLSLLFIGSDAYAVRITDFIAQGLTTYGQKKFRIPSRSTLKTGMTLPQNMTHEQKRFMGHFNKGETMEGKILEVALMGHAILKNPAKKIENAWRKGVLKPEIEALIKDMEATIKYRNCSGLAAPQVFIPLRLAIFRVPKTTTNIAYELTPQFDPEGVPWTVMINPTFKRLSEEQTIGWESCQSVPDFMGKVPRYHSIEYAFLNREGKEEKRIAHGFHAIVVQHECDHLDGILFPQRMKDISTLGYKKEIMRTLEEEKRLKEENRKIL